MQNEAGSHLRVESVPITAVSEHPQNARRGDVELIRESLRLHGQYVPIVVQRSTGYVIKGNHTHRAATEEGWQTIDVVYVDKSDDEALRIMLVDNRASDAATDDEHSLAALLQSLDTLEGTGYTPADLTDLLAMLAPPTLDELSSDPNEFSHEALWPVLRFKVAPEVRDRYLRLIEGVPGSDADLFAHLVTLAER